MRNQLIVALSIVFFTTIRPATAQSGLAEHPRLFFSVEEESAVRAKAAGNPLLSQLMDLLRKEADLTLSEAPQAFIPDAELLAISREEVARMVKLSMAYRLFKDDRYARKVEEELVNVCQYPSWNPKHFLDVAEMTTAVAIGYDWCYDRLSAATRKLAEDAIRDKAFDPAWPIYEDKGKTPFNRENNWNMVCNSGLLSGAVAIGDKYPVYLKRILDYAVRYTPHLLESFAPEGAYNEGPGYWSYNAMYMALFFDNLRRNIHKDYGLPAYQGVSNTARFYMNLIGPSRLMFNFGDAPSHIDHSGTFFFLSRLYGQPDVAQFYRDLITRDIREYNAGVKVELPRYFFMAIPWFDDSPVTAATAGRKLETFNGVTDFIIINGGPRDDSNRLYVAAKTGRPNWSHNHLDVGSFVTDCDGERWGIDLGAEKYSLPHFWDYKPGGVRWSYFRNSNLSHNTLAIDDKITNSDGQGELAAANKETAQPFGILDMGAAYKDQASSVRRGFKLLSPKVVLVRDEIKPEREAQKISWKFFTMADVTVNGDTAMLSQHGKSFYIVCLPGSGARMAMSVQEVRAHSEKEKPVDGVRLVEITASLSGGGEEVSIPVLMGNDLAQCRSAAADNSPLSSWK